MKCAEHDEAQYWISIKIVPKTSYCWAKERGTMKRNDKWHGIKNDRSRKQNITRREWDQRLWHEYWPNRSVTEMSKSVRKPLAYPQNKPVMLNFIYHNLNDILKELQLCYFDIFPSKIIMKIKTYDGILVLLKCHWNKLKGTFSLSGAICRNRDS